MFIKQVIRYKGVLIGSAEAITGKGVFIIIKKNSLKISTLGYLKFRYVAIFYGIQLPPLGLRICPVKKLLSSLAKYNAAVATS